MELNKVFNILNQLIEIKIEIQLVLDEDLPDGVVKILRSKLDEINNKIDTIKAIELNIDSTVIDLLESSTKLVEDYYK